MVSKENPKEEQNKHNRKEKIKKLVMLIISFLSILAILGMCIILTLFIIYQDVNIIKIPCLITFFSGMLSLLLFAVDTFWGI